MGHKHKKNSVYKALLALENEKEVKLFIRDLCTPAEIKAIEERWEIVQLLYTTDWSYRKISEKTGASTTTIGRVARFLNDERNKGYKILLDRLLENGTQ